MQGPSAWLVIANKVIIEGSNEGLFVYDGTAALGNLIASITSLGTSLDPEGNDTFPGIAAYLPNGTALATTIIQMLDGQLSLGAGFQFAGTGGASVAAVTVFAGAGSGSSLGLNSGVDTSTDVPANLSVVSADSTGGGSTTGTIQVDSPIVLGDTVTPPVSDHFSMIYADTNATVRAVYNNDANTYAVGHKIVQGTMTPGSPQTITSTTFVNVNGISGIPVGVGSYRFRAHIQFAGGAAAGSPSFQITVGGGAVASKQYGTGLYFPSGGTTVGTNARTGSMLFQGPTMITTESGIIIEAFATFSTGGTVSLQAETSAAADSIIIHNANFQLDAV